MKKLLIATFASVLLAGCQLTPAENVQALREVNNAKLNLVISREFKASADAQASNAHQRVIAAEERLEKAKQNFETIYKQ